MTDQSAVHGEAEFNPDEELINSMIRREDAAVHALRQRFGPISRVIQDPKTIGSTLTEIFDFGGTIVKLFVPANSDPYYICETGNPGYGKGVGKRYSITETMGHFYREYLEQLLLEEGNKS